jgi:hypothetical protein
MPICGKCSTHFGTIDELQTHAIQCGAVIPLQKTSDFSGVIDFATTPIHSDIPNIATPPTVSERAETVRAKLRKARGDAGE